MHNQADQILSSQISVLLDNRHWLRKTHGRNIFWFPMFADYYWTFRAESSQWWYVDDQTNLNAKLKLDDAPEIESRYQLLLSPAVSEKKESKEFEVLEKTRQNKIGDVWYSNFVCSYKGVYWLRHSEVYENADGNFVRWHSPDVEKEYFFGINDKFRHGWQCKDSENSKWFETFDTPDIEQKYQEYQKNA